MKTYNVIATSAAGTFTLKVQAENISDAIAHGMEFFKPITEDRQWRILAVIMENN